MKRKVFEILLNYSKHVRIRYLLTETGGKGAEFTFSNPVPLTESEYLEGKSNLAFGIGLEIENELVYMVITSESALPLPT